MECPNGTEHSNDNLRIILSCIDFLNYIIKQKFGRHTKYNLVISCVFDSISIGSYHSVRYFVKYQMYESRSCIDYVEWMDILLMYNRKIITF
jgi:hypothetical protein